MGSLVMTILLAMYLPLFHMIGTMGQIGARGRRLLMRLECAMSERDIRRCQKQSNSIQC